MSKSLKEMIFEAKQRDESKILAYCHKCLSLSTTKEEFLYPYKLHKIHIPVKNFTGDTKLIKIHNHILDQPYRIINQYVCLTKNHPYISLYIISSKFRKLAPHEEFCHMSFCQPEEAFVDVKGKYISALNKYFKQIFLLKIFILIHFLFS